MFVGAWLAEIGVVMYTGRAVEWTSEASRGVGGDVGADLLLHAVPDDLPRGCCALYVVLAALQKRRGLVPRRPWSASCVDGGDMVLMDAPNHPQSVRPRRPARDAAPEEQHCHEAGQD